MAGLRSEAMDLHERLAAKAQESHALLDSLSLEEWTGLLEGANKMASRSPSGRRFRAFVIAQAAARGHCLEPEALG